MGEPITCDALRADTLDVPGRSKKQRIQALMEGSTMSERDPLAPGRQGLNEEDMALLGHEDVDEMADVTSDPMEAADSAEPYMAPTDPPVVPSGGPDNIEVAEGFAPTSEGAEERAGMPGDEEI